MPGTRKIFYTYIIDEVIQTDFDNIKVFYSPTDAQVNRLKNNVKI
jgi:hypothetical protein